MRVLVASAPLLGHVFPLLPLSLALRDAGHEVLVATAADGLAAARSGLPVRDVAPAFDFGRIARGVMLRHPLIARAELTGTAGTRGGALLFGQVNEELADGLVALAREWSPDLVVYEPFAVAGALAAARVGVPAVRHENSLFDGRELVRVTSERLTRALRRHRVAAIPPPAGAIAVSPPSVVAQDGWPMRYEPYAGGGELPGWLREPGERPRVLVSRSTVAGPGGAGPMRAVVAVADRVDAEFVLVRPDGRLSRSALPANVRTVDWIPLNAALPAAAGLVHHGGAGGVLGALAAGVPQVATLGPGDRRYNARLAADRGVGIAAPAGGITADVLTRLVTDAELAAAAGQVSREIAAMPPPAELVARLESLR
ncbi:nucleotide disphospho-sugar-binding domain-containing protein [Micromonospora narathiwatensis]|uniref:UDP:flavonoid glycosyltransferase YjiC, YdhE family n=1 Tax=Micromonospora narathiwatensis TaxID=299146 RepID=A0A1A8ZE52_9ACTN|nr:nucleotide disphospho-sugar-binding domain-containing protein [Micromonospora narathiwatensis]SBT42141.1 UDP:flavonoid glycosyltransferase YjiC, YdhE family [Micromonospora narathiwatensis]